MMSIIGYCLFPFVVAAFLNWILRSLIGFIGVRKNYLDVCYLCIRLPVVSKVIVTFL